MDSIKTKCKQREVNHIAKYNIASDERLDNEKQKEVDKLLTEF